jgi:HAD superfamily phosphoserine phosphatase-like hydrolase
MNDIKLIAFDLDGTLLRGESCCEVLARHLGHLARMKEFETLRDQEDIANARKELIGYYNIKSKEELKSVIDHVAYAPGVFEAFALIKEKNIKTAIVSITFEFAVEAIAKKLGADYYVGTNFDDKGTIQHFWPEHKGIWLEELIRSIKIRQDEVAVVGDSWGDIYMLEMFDKSYFVGIQKPEQLMNTKHYPDGDILEIVEDIIDVAYSSRQ